MTESTLKYLIRLVREQQSIALSNLAQAHTIAASYPPGTSAPFDFGRLHWQKQQIEKVLEELTV
jgi:hypothetical protein